ncbi:glycosyltransferase [Aquabacterium sp. OR-4]|uniref:glycosyltransferase n=1 Tax=Aquabacterium sp. OR-4 TaxID=2978127 RepID=UPI0021B3855B|nr:glycosyltransferase [Aquabacterium sp. OR-4]MDT7833909.1 glycosyltransferase [Aquabacterium sp. OR-4]
MAHHYLIGWELGGGLGHAGRVKPLAAGLHARGHHVTLALRDLVQTRRLLADLPCPRLQAPVWLHRAVGVPEQQVSLPEILMGCGYIDADAVDALVQGWLALIALSGAQALVVDYAPSALIAARIAGLPAASVGMGFWMPPHQQPMPAYRDWEPIAPGRLARAEQLVFDNVNRVLTRHGAAPLAQLSHLFGGDMPLLCSWPEIDHYDRGNTSGDDWLGPNYLPQSGRPPQWPAGQGPHVFAYLKSTHPDHVAVLQALVSLGCQVECYLPEVAGGKPPPVVSPQVHYADGPVDLGQACARADLLVCHAGQATMVQALLAGVPVLLLPMQAEQFLMARQVERAGLGLSAALRRRPTDFKALIQGLLAADAPQRHGARAFAERRRGFTHDTQVQDLLARLERLPRA